MARQQKERREVKIGRSGEGLSVMCALFYEMKAGTIHHKGIQTAPWAPQVVKGRAVALEKATSVLCLPSHSTPAMTPCCPPSSGVPVAQAAELRLVFLLSLCLWHCRWGHWKTSTASDWQFRHPMRRWVPAGSPSAWLQGCRLGKWQVSITSMTCTGRSCFWHWKNLSQSCRSVVA